MVTRAFENFQNTTLRLLLVLPCFGSVSAVLSSGDPGSRLSAKVTCSRNKFCYVNDDEQLTRFWPRFALELDENWLRVMETFFTSLCSLQITAANGIG